MTHSLVLPLRVTPQPVPFLVSGGDCGACVLSGLSGKTIPEVYQRLFGDKIQSVSFFEMKRALRCDDAFGWDGYMDEWPMMWSGVFEPWHSFGIQGRHQQHKWFQYVRMAMEAGYYAIANVRYDKSGPNCNGADHWVLLCGFRTVKVPLGEGASRIDHEVLVSCSATGTPAEEWVVAHDFLANRGGFNVMLVRPRPAS